jgi:MFS family permease
VLIGLTVFLAGLALVVAALSQASLALFLIGTIVSGVAIGAVFLASLSTANRLAPAEIRGQVLSTYFVFLCVGITIPVIGVGLASQYAGDFRTVLVCAIALAALSAVSMAGIYRVGSQ